MMQVIKFEPMTFALARIDLAVEPTVFAFLSFRSKLDNAPV